MADSTGGNTAGGARTSLDELAANTVAERPRFSERTRGSGMRRAIDRGEPRQDPNRLGPYRIHERLAEGGMGVVYRAEHVVSGARVAIKTVLLPEDALLASIRREIRALCRIRHPGVVAVLDEGVEQNLPWYAMPLLEGRTFRQLIESLWSEARASQPTVQLRLDAHGVPQSEPPPRSTDSRAGIGSGRLLPIGAGRLDELLGLAEKLCESLAFLHGEGIVHRDLKPDNVFVRDDGVPVLVDFGLVGRFGGPVGREVLDVDTVIAGSAPYMAPEQIRGELVDARTDLYSLGCMLYECIAGRRPFDGTSVPSLFAQHISAVPSPISRFVSPVPAELERLLGQLLEKRPRDRAGHASDVARSLAEIRGGKSARRPLAAELVARAYLYRPELTGRDQLIDALQVQLFDAKLGEGKSLLVGGESGSGKTRVALEVARLATLMGIQVVGAECVALGTAGERGNARGAPLYVFRPLLQAIADRCTQLGEATTAELLGHRARVLARYEPAILQISGMERQPIPPPLNVEAERDRALHYMRESLAAFCSQQTLLLVLDDLQWADELSLSFLDSLGGEFLRRKNLVIVATYRTEEATALSDLLCRPWVEKIRLARLEPHSVGRMVSDMLGVQEAPEPFVQFLSEASEGNPFFVAEYLRAAVGENLLFRSRSGAWVVGDAERPLEQALALPGSLRELVERRLSGLGPNARALLEAGAVLGREASWELFAGVSGLGEADAMEAARELLERQIMEEPESGKLRFAHDKLREVAYENTTASRRVELHASAARIIEAEHRQYVDFPLVFATLAQHYGRAQDHAKCFEYLERAGIHALASGAHRDAIQLFSQALERHADNPAGHTALVSAERRAHWHRLLGDAWYGQGELERLNEHCLAALELLGQPAPRTRSAWARVLATNAARQLALGVAPSFARPASSRDREALLDASLAAARLGQRHYFANDAIPMVASSLLAVNLAERAGASAHAARPYSLLGIVCGVSGLHRLAETYFKRWQRSAAATRDDYGFVVGAYTKIAYLSGLGRWAEAAEVGRQGLIAAERLGDRHELETLNTVIANTQLFTGKFTHAHAMFSDIKSSARARGNPRYEAWGLYAGGAALLALGRLDEAVEDLEHAAELLHGASDVASEIICHGTLALARLRLGDHDRARREADAASERIWANPPTVYSTLNGYAGCAEVYSALWADAKRRRTDDERALRHAVRRALFQLALFARFLPVGAPAALLQRGRFNALAGRRRRATRLLSSAIGRAELLGMHYERARALLELAKLAAPGSSQGLTRSEQAREAFSSMACMHHMSELEAEFTE